MTTPDLPTAGERVPVETHRYRDAVPRPVLVGQHDRENLRASGLADTNQPQPFIFAVDGNWGSWQPWGECSASCGGGERSRIRLCNNPSPSDGGRPCPGDASQLSRCNTQPCPGRLFYFKHAWARKFSPQNDAARLTGGPQKARGNIIGNINDIEFGISILNATVTTSQTGDKVIKATITNVPRTLGQFSADTEQQRPKGFGVFLILLVNGTFAFFQGPAMRKLVSILNPIYWTTAQEVGEAVNGFTLTEGVFRRETQVEFATGKTGNSPRSPVRAGAYELANSEDVN